ncbi:hypothetical protein GCM10022244_30340 [Streptomyces gulbargensis]|uniref:Uncharacterized protein n=1 Tax=Streptomyces gulbargensis TaxID=364901 RepID=A0ABP7MBD4_9ACTN
MEARADDGCCGGAIGAQAREDGDRSGFKAFATVSGDPPATPWPDHSAGGGARGTPATGSRPCERPHEGRRSVVMGMRRLTVVTIVTLSDVHQI